MTKESWSFKKQHLIYPAVVGCVVASYIAILTLIPSYNPFKQVAKLRPFDEEVYGVLVVPFEREKDMGSDSQICTSHDVAQTLSARLLELGVKGVQVKHVAEEPVPSLQGHSDARKFGARYRASLVIWGNVTSVGIIPHLTIIQQTWLKPTDVVILNDLLTHEAIRRDADIRLPYITDIPIRIASLAAGFVQAYSGEPSAAISTLGAVLELDPNCIFAYCFRGDAYRKMNDFENSIHSYDLALALPEEAVENHERFLAYLGRGTTYYHMGNHLDQAIADFNRCLEIELTDNSLEPQVYYLRGLCRVDMNDNKAALSDFARALRSDPKLVEAYVARAFLFSITDRVQQAVHEISEALRVDSESPELYARRSVYLAGLREYEEAISDAKQALKLDPKEPKALFVLGVSYYETGNARKALSNLNKAWKLGFQPPLLHRLRGDAYYAKDSFTKAIAAFSDAIDKNPEYAIAYKRRGEAWIAVGDCKLALMDLKTALRLDPNLHDAYFPIGWCYDELGDTDAATNAYEEYIRHLPQDKQPSIRDLIDRQRSSD